jgi:Xaa-Pro aminopeptidase
MRVELDSAMKEAGFDGMLILGPADHNPAMRYFTGPVHISMGYLLKRAGQPPLLFHDSMERDEAALSGLPTRLVEDFEDHELRELYARDGQEATAIHLARMLKAYGLKGKVAVYGRTELGRYFGVLRRIESMLPDIEFISENTGRRLLYQIRTTKDEAEVERIRRMGEITVEVVGRTAELLISCRVRRGVLIGPDGQPLTIGDVKPVAGRARGRKPGRDDFLHRPGRRRSSQRRPGRLDHSHRPDYHFRHFPLRAGRRLLL